MKETYNMKKSNRNGKSTLSLNSAFNSSGGDASKIERANKYKVDEEIKEQPDEHSSEQDTKKKGKKKLKGSA